MIRRLSGAVLAAAVAGVLLGGFGFAGSAAAHVTVEPEEAEQGGYAAVVFRVPNERDDAATDKVEVVMPEDHPIASVRTMDVPGWKIAVKTRTLDTPVEVHGEQVDEVVDRVTWTATKGHELQASEFVEFPVSVGPLPEDADRMVFKTLQTYDNGEVVRWIEEPQEGEAEPENPAPVLTLTRPATDNGSPAPAPAAAEADTGTGTPLWLGVAGLVAGLAGLVLGAAAYRRTSTATSGS